MSEFQFFSYPFFFSFLAFTNYFFIFFSFLLFVIFLFFSKSKNKQKKLLKSDSAKLLSINSIHIKKNCHAHKIVNFWNFGF